MTAAVGAALTMTVAGCGADTGAGRGDTGKGQGKDKSAGAHDERTDARAVLLAAAEKTGAQTSYKTVQTGHGGSDRSEMLYQKKPAATVIKAWVTKSSANPTGISHMVAVDGATYVKTDKVPGKKWYRMDTGVIGASRAAGYVPEFTGALAATKSTKWVAEEKVGGRPADHYRGTVVLKELARYTGAALDKDVRDAYVEGARKQGLTSVVIDLWVGKDDLVLKSRETGDGSKGREELNEVYSDFGAVPEVAAPAAGTVASWDEFIGAQATP
ncbi:hypothetical protein ACIBKX_17735 [Streptomyces sp. NPDC050658]|uniref:hypothetical protein n=1 Tax=unclassified Streptomyces TaxID=2593676 RepID=UPI003444151E